ncbi:MAG: hypothetical protein E7164_02945 [Firmicutes bacterium]|nr:hypothetical protein [Bacillota bacterium]
MKVKYLRLNKEERKKAKNNFYQTDTGKYVRKQLFYATICSILCVVASIYLIYDAFANNLSLMEKIYSICILIIGFFLLVARRKIFIKKVNEYVIKTK